MHLICFSLNFVICKNERQVVISTGELFSHLFFMGKHTLFFVKYLLFVVIVLVETKLDIVFSFSTFR